MNTFDHRAEPSRMERSRARCIILAAIDVKPMSAPDLMHYAKGLPMRLKFAARMDALLAELVATGEIEELPPPPVNTDRVSPRGRWVATKPVYRRRSPPPLALTLRGKA